MPRRQPAPKPDIPPPNTAATVAHILPVAAAQAFALWAALTDSLDYFDYQLLVVAELLLVQLSLALTTAPRDRKNRWSNLALTAFVVGPLLLLFNALLVPIAMEMPGENLSPFALVGGAIEHLAGDGLRYAFGYLALGFGVAIVQARCDAQPLAWWHRQVVARNTIETLAFVLGIFAMAPVIIARQQIAWVGSLEAETIGVVLIVIMIALRLGLTLRWDGLVRSGKLDPEAEIAREAPRRRRGARRVRGAGR